MDIRKQQNLLQYLGYYEGNVDGIYGKLTEGAIADFRADNGMPNLGEELEEVLIGAVFHSKFKNATSSNKESNKDWWGNIKYFGRHEFACKCGRCGGYPVEPDRKLVELLDDFREEISEPVYINSGIRCAEHNANVGGASQSRHMLYGDAADIRCDGKTPREMYNIAERLLPNSGGIGIYNWGIHIDTRTVKARWNG